MTLGPIPPSMRGTRRCCTCGEDKPAFRFYVASNDRCMDCRNRYDRAWRLQRRANRRRSSMSREPRIDQVVRTGVERHERRETIVLGDKLREVIL